MGSSEKEEGDDETTYDLVNYRGLSLVNNTLKMLPAINNIKGRPDDILVTSFPKSGTTWTQAMVQLILHGTLSRITPLGMNDQWCFLDLAYYTKPMPVEEVEKQPSPRLLKTHFPWPLIPASILQTKSKIIYIYRNPKDVMVSLYHFCKNVPAIQQSCPHDTFQNFVEAFISDRVIYAPYFENLASFWAHRYDQNVFILSYEGLHRAPYYSRRKVFLRFVPRLSIGEAKEDLAPVCMRYPPNSTDPHGNVKKLGKFLGKELRSDEVNEIVESSSFSEMEKSESINRMIRRSSLAHQNPNSKKDGPAFKFLRCGKVNQWKEYFTPELLQKVDQWITINLSKKELKGFAF